jgi:hypothetical protein
MSVRRHVILPDSRVKTPEGLIVCCLPDEIAYSPQAKVLADAGAITIEGYTPQKVETPVEPVTAVESGQTEEAPRRRRR